MHGRNAPIHSILCWNFNYNPHLALINRQSVSTPRRCRIFVVLNVGNQFVYIRLDTMKCCRDYVDYEHLLDTFFAHAFRGKDYVYVTTVANAISLMSTCLAIIFLSYVRNSP